MEIEFIITLEERPADLRFAREYLREHQFHTLSFSTTRVKGRRYCGTGPAANFASGIASVVSEVETATEAQVEQIRAWPVGQATLASRQRRQPRS